MSTEPINVFHHLFSIMKFWKSFNSILKDTAIVCYVHIIYRKLLKKLKIKLSRLIPRKISQFAKFHHNLLFATGFIHKVSSTRPDDDTMNLCAVLSLCLKRSSSYDPIMNTGLCVWDGPQIKEYGGALRIVIFSLILIVKQFHGVSSYTIG
jgi:hypothetical protein